MGLNFDWSVRRCRFVCGKADALSQTISILDMYKDHLFRMWISFVSSKYELQNK